MTHEIKVAEVLTLFGFAREGDQDPEHLFRTAEGRNTELSRVNLFSFKFAAEMDINVRSRVPIDVTAIRTEDGRYFHLVDMPKGLLKD
jgi:hypothetical protein